MKIINGILLALTTFAVLLTTGCSSSSTETCDECADLETRCSGEVVERCLVTEGCPTWTVVEDCAETPDSSCSYDGNRYRCVAMGEGGCNNLVCSPGEKSCINGVTHECNFTDNYDCGALLATGECEDQGLVCSANMDEAWLGCVAACEDECEQSDDLVCSQDVTAVVFCGWSDGCLKWVTLTDCAQDGLVCDDGEGYPFCIEPPK